MYGHISVPGFILLCDHPEEVAGDNCTDPRFGKNNSTTLSAVVPQTAEQISGAACVDYPADFESVLDRARGIAAAKERSPRIWVASAAVISQIPANYNAWLWRRNVLFEKDGKSFVESCLQTAGAEKEDKNRDDDDDDDDGDLAFITDAKSAVFESDISNSFTGEERRRAAAGMLAAWAPSRKVLLPAAAGGGGKVGGGYCVCRAAAWEMANCKSVATTFVKGFQAWNHRRDVLERAAALWNNCPCKGRCGVPFRAFDERSLTEAVLLSSQKNYHVWLHRTWFLSFFGILLTEAGRERELTFCNALIERDVFNNSAWTHRGFVFRYCLASVEWEKRNASSSDEESSLWGSATSPSSSLPRRPLRAFPSWIQGMPLLLVPADQRDAQEAAARTLRSEGGLALVQAEIQWALQSTAIEPRNEAPWTYISGLLSLAQRSFGNATSDNNASSSLGPFFTGVLNMIGNEENFSCRVAPELDCEPELPDVTPERLKMGDPVSMPMMLAAVSSSEQQQQQQQQPQSSYPACLRKGSTKQIEMTAPTLYRDTVLFQIHRANLKLVATSVAVGGQEDAKHAATAEVIRVGTRLCRIDPYRRKFWQQELAAAISSNI